MYAGLLFAMSALLALALAGAELTSAFALAGSKQAARQYAERALDAARATFVAQIAEQIRAGDLDGPFVAPPPAPNQPVCATPPGASPPPCPFDASVSVTLDGQTGDGSVPNQTALALQRHAAVSENRVAAELVATLRSPSGALAAIVRRHVVLRTYAVPPYATDDGSDEATVDGVVSGDSAASCNGSAACGGVDTRIHATIYCVNPVCSGTHYLSADEFRDEDWHDAAAEPRAWSR